MRLTRLLLFAAMSLFSSVGAGIARAVEFTLELISPSPRSFAFSGAPRFALSTIGCDQVDGTTFNQARHESAVHRRSAERKI